MTVCALPNDLLLRRTYGRVLECQILSGTTGVVHQGNIFQRLLVQESEWRWRRIILQQHILLSSKSATDCGYKRPAR